MTDGMEQEAEAPTGLGEVGAHETGIIDRVVDYPSGPLAWSDSLGPFPVEQPWQQDHTAMRPAARMGDPPLWPRLTQWLRYLVPAAIVAVILVIVLGGKGPQNGVPAAGTPITTMVPAVAPQPPTTTPPTWAPVQQWTPTQAEDDQYINAMINAGWDVGNRQESIDNAHFSCTFLSQGHTKKELVHYWDQRMFQGDNAVQNHIDDEEWMGIVMNNMCPQYN